MTPEQQALASRLREQFLADQEKYEDKIVLLFKQFSTVLARGVQMKDVFPPRGLVDTFVKSVSILQLSEMRDANPGRDPREVEMESYCAGIILGLFLSETGLAQLITREK